MSERVYLDYAAGAPLLEVARDAMADVWSLPGNPSSLHGSGRRARRLLEESREAIAGCLGAHPSEVVFTSGGTEANNLVLLGAARADPSRPGLAIADGEHPSVAGVTGLLPGLVEVMPLDADGRLVPSGLRVIDARTALVSAMLVNNETGVIQDLAPVRAAAAEAGARVHTDAVQAFGHLPLDFAGLDVDAMTVTAHKIGGPVGIGALVLRRDAQLTAPGFGGGQERKLRSGTAMVALACGFAAAAISASERRAVESVRLAGLREELAASILRQVPDVTVNGGAPVSPAILNVTFHGCRADDLLLMLDAADIDCSTGSACTAGVHQPSEVLLAMGRPRADAEASLRFSLGRFSDESAIGALVAALPEAVVRARAAFL